MVSSIGIVIFPALPRVLSETLTLVVRFRNAWSGYDNGGRRMLFGVIGRALVGSCCEGIAQRAPLIESNVIAWIPILVTGH